MTNWIKYWERNQGKKLKWWITPDGETYRAVEPRSSRDELGRHFKKPKKVAAQPEPAQYYRLTDFSKIDANWLRARVGKCALCGRGILTEKLTDRSIHLDHDHATGHARGFLCIGCNLALGLIDKIVRRKGWDKAIFSEYYNPVNHVKPVRRLSRADIRRKALLAFHGIGDE